MDHFSFIFSLLLIVSVTTSTFGSSIKENTLNEEVPEEQPKTKRGIEALLGDAGLTNFPEMVPNRRGLLKRSHDAEVKPHGLKDFEDQGNEKFKRIAAGTVIAATELTIGLLKELLNALANVDRKCAVGIENKSGFRWQEGSTYFFSGTADENLPYSVTDDKAVLYGPRKTDGPVATGVVGVIAYYIPDISKTLAVMFSVPFDYNLYDNWWNAKLYPGNKDASYDQYSDLYYHASPFKAGGWEQRSLGSGLKFRGSMSTSGKATLEIEVLKE